MDTTDLLKWTIEMDLCSDNPCATAANSWYWRMFNSFDVAIGPPLRIGEREPVAVAEHVRRVEDLDRPAAERDLAPHRAGPSSAWPARSHTRPASSILVHTHTRRTLADRGAVVVAPGHGGAVAARQHIVVVDAAARVRTAGHEGLRRPAFGRSCHNACRRRPPTSTTAPATAAPRDSVSRRASSPCSPSLPARKNAP